MMYVFVVDEDLVASGQQLQYCFDALHYLQQNSGSLGKSRHIYLTCEPFILKFIKFKLELIRYHDLLMCVNIAI